MVSELRRVMKERTIDELHKRNNVEATISNSASSYGTIKQDTEANSNTKYGHIPGACG